MAEVKVGGVWLHSLGHVADIKWATRWGTGPCGSDLASCTVAVDPANDSGLLKLAKTFEVWADDVLVFAGVTSEMGRGFPRTINAKGLPRLAANFDAVDASGIPTTNPRTAVTQAIADGLPSWSNPTAFDNVSLGADGAPTTQRLDVALDNYMVTVGKRWGTDVYGVAFASTDPTTPTWYLDASDLDIGVADDGLYTRVRARYGTSLDADGQLDAWATATAPTSPSTDPAVIEYGSLWYPMDLTPLMVITAPTAAAHAAAQLALLTVPQWLSRVTTNAGRLLTAGGLGAHLPSVAAGQMVRLFNVPNNLGGLRGELGLDVVLGEVEYDTTNPTEVTIAPVGLAVRNLADALAEAKRAADQATETRRSAA